MIFLHAIENLGGTTIMAAEAKSRAAISAVIVAKHPLTTIVPIGDAIRAARS
jgi:hypothetical protein